MQDQVRPFTLDKSGDGTVPIALRNILIEFLGFPLKLAGAIAVELPL